MNLKSVYNRIAPLFSSTREYLWNDLKPLSRFVHPGDVVVDLGCGNGRLYQLIREVQASYIGVDQSEGMIDIARSRFPDGRFLIGALTKTRLQDAIADVIFCIAAFHHLESQKLRIESLREMSRILKAGGTIVMTNWNLYSNWARSKEFQPDDNGDFMIPWKNAAGEILGTRYYHGFLFEELHELAAASGFEIIEQYYTKDGEVSSLGPGDNILTVMKLRRQ